MDAFKNYLAEIENGENRARLGEVLSWVRKEFPGLEPKIAWNQPMFTDHGTFIIGFSVSRHHVAVSPEAKGIVVFSNEIAESGYTRGSHLFRIKWSEPVDHKLLERIIRYNMEDKADCKTFWRK